MIRLLAAGEHGDDVTDTSQKQHNQDSKEEEQHQQHKRRATVKVPTITGGSRLPLTRTRTTRVIKKPVNLSSSAPKQTMASRRRLTELEKLMERKKERDAAAA